ncbi:rab2a [Anaeramoeba flamelloides]|uniref:Rab2a n=1 Tax=Anaeramoeba flamelloides TaxID=1746091 RepID=A0ABQ8YAE9_9EUKA|nr:rab2a [Anaeramoeba flamelloides]
MILVGNSGVGKSCILLRYLHDEFQSDYEVTIGAEFGSKSIEIKNETLKLQIWDTAGQESFRSMTSAYFRHAVGVLVVYDITRRATFDNLISWIEDAKLNAPENCQLTLVGNKTDLVKSREITYEEGEKFAKEHGLLFFETSACSSENIDLVFKETAKLINSKVKNGSIKREEIIQFSVDPEQKSDDELTINIRNQGRNSSTGCC